MKPIFSLIAFCALLTSAARAEFEDLWVIGEDDDSQAEFSQEQGVNDPPGDAFALDDDFYLMGSYPDPIGDLDEDEDWFNFERAVTSGDGTVRIHFNLDESQADPMTQFRLTFDMIALGSANNGAGIHDLEYSFNGEVFETLESLEEPFLVESVVAAGDVAAVEGENIVAVTRTGGTGASWIQFDYVKMEVDTGCEEALCSFTASSGEISPGESVTLSWVGNIDSTFAIEGMGPVDAVNGVGSIEVEPTANTTYTLTATLDGEEISQSVEVKVRIIESFSASASAVPEGNMVTLSWVSDPAATLTISPGVGEVDAGENSVEVSPTPPATTYTLTATRGDDQETAEVNVLVAAFVQLWQIGDDNETQSEFSQERGVNPPPGEPDFLDDDYYLAGTYPDPIGVLEEDEPWVNFERAVTSGDANVRIHFNLDELQADPKATFRVTFDMIALGSSGNGPGIHDLLYSMNGEPLEEILEAEEPFLLETVAEASAVKAKAGENVIEVSRTGGTDASWIQFDFVRFEADTTAVGCTEAICNFVTDKTVMSAGQSATLSWIAHPSAALSIDPELNLQSDNGQGSISVSPESNTTYTLTSVLNGETTTATVTVNVRAIESYTTTADEVRDGESFTLAWAVDPSAEVAIEGIGPVETFDGVGELTIDSIKETTEYKLVVTRGPDTEERTIEVAFNEFSLLWQIGDDNGNQSEFVQENGNSNDPPGDPEGRDDDYYFAGTYEDEEIGEVEEDEDWMFFERALTSGDTFSRIHFNLSDDQVTPDTRYQLTFDLVQLGSSGEESTHDLEFRFNDTLIAEQAEITRPTIVRAQVNAGDVEAVAGENLIEIERIGGSGGSWIQFDRITAEIAGGSAAGTGLAFTDIGLNEANGEVALTWTSRIGKTYTVESSEDLSDWSELTDGHPQGGATEATTQFTDDSGFPESGTRYYRVREESE